MATVDREDEQRISELLTGKGLRVENFLIGKEESKQTPDFIVHAEDQPAFYCEVKSIVEDRWLYDLVREAPEGILVGGEKQDPTRNRITTKIHEAVAQFRSVNPKSEYPNVLAFVNHDNMCCRWITLLEALTGFFFTEEGERHPIFRRYSEGRIKKEKMDIDLYIWDDDLRGVNYLYTRRNPKHLAALCGYFSISPTDIGDLY